MSLASQLPYLGFLYIYYCVPLSQIGKEQAIEKFLGYVPM